MDFDIATRRLQQDQQSAYAKVRASQRAQRASASARRANVHAKFEQELRIRQRKREAEIQHMYEARVQLWMSTIEKDLGLKNVGGGVWGMMTPRTTLTTTTTAAAIANADAPNSQGNEKLLLEPRLFAKGYTFAATSIHGEGDKITLPPSVLEMIFASSSSSDSSITATNNNNNNNHNNNNNSGRPIAFRIGIPNDKYVFPSSEKMKTLVQDVKRKIISAHPMEDASTGMQTLKNEYDEHENEEGENEDEEEEEVENSATRLQLIAEAYMDELSYRYLSYTHGTVVEFTEEEGHVGLPESVTKALLHPNKYSLVAPNSKTSSSFNIPIKRTVDAAAAAAAAAAANNTASEDHDEYDSMETDFMSESVNYFAKKDEDNNEERTPGHPAYGLFDIPALPIEIVPIYNIPPGKHCTFTPTRSSIEHGFYNLKDIKLVLEQSLMRTRATLSLGDVIRTWRRGVSYDLIVSKLEPAKFGVVSCVNTDMNVDIGPPEEDNDSDTVVDGGHDHNITPLSARRHDGIEERKDMTHYDPPLASGGGRLLSEKIPSLTPQLLSSTLYHTQHESNTARGGGGVAVALPPEPEEDVKVGVCAIQIIHGRTSSGNGTVTSRRRFLVGSATVMDMFAFASQTCCDGADPMTFRLVTRFPRRVYTLSASSSSSSNDGSNSTTSFDGKMTLESAGISQGQETFMVEMM